MADRFLTDDPGRMPPLPQAMALLWPYLGAEHRAMLKVD